MKKDTDSMLLHRCASDDDAICGQGVADLVESIQYGAELCKTKEEWLEWKFLLGRIIITLMDLARAEKKGGMN